MREENTAVSEACLRGARLPAAPKQVWKVLKWSLNPVCRVYEALFQGPQLELEKSREDIFECMQAVMCNPLCNARRTLGLSNPDHYRIGLRDRSSFVVILLTVMDV